MASLTSTEKVLLKAADNDGFIPFPPGDSRRVGACLDTLESLSKKGFVIRKMRNKFYRAYYLTPQAMAELTGN